MSRKAQLIALCTVVCVAVLAGFWFLAAKPRKQHVQELQAQVQTQQTANSQLQTKIAMLQDVQRRLPAQQAKADQLAAKIPTDPALVALIHQLSDAADRAGVTLTGIAPQKPSSLSVAPGISGIPVALTVTGDYASLQQYELELEALQRAFLVTGLTVNGASGATSSGTVTELSETVSGTVLTGTPTGTTSTSSTSTATS